MEPDPVAYPRARELAEQKRLLEEKKSLKTQVSKGHTGRGLFGGSLQQMKALQEQQQRALAELFSF